jgi:hypothetical protein
MKELALFALCLSSVICCAACQVNATCVPLYSQLCHDYIGLMIPSTESVRFDMDVFFYVNLQGHSCKGYVPGLTSMRCYSQLVVASYGKCINYLSVIKKPCKSSCQAMYRYMLDNCFSSGDPVNPNVCGDLPNENCISEASILSYLMIYFISAVLFHLML